MKKTLLKSSSLMPQPRQSPNLANPATAAAFAVLPNLVRLRSSFYFNAKDVVAH
jgi:hypothetical protein